MASPAETASDVRLPKAPSASPAETSPEPRLPKETSTDSEGLTDAVGVRVSVINPSGCFTDSAGLSDEEFVQASRSSFVGFAKSLHRGDTKVLVDDTLGQRKTVWYMVVANLLFGVVWSAWLMFAGLEQNTHPNCFMPWRVWFIVQSMSSLFMSGLAILWIRWELERAMNINSAKWEVYEAQGRSMQAEKSFREFEEEGIEVPKALMMAVKFSNSFGFFWLLAGTFMEWSGGKKCGQQTGLKHFYGGITFGIQLIFIGIWTWCRYSNYHFYEMVVGTHAPEARSVSRNDLPEMASHSSLRSKKGLGGLGLGGISPMPVKAASSGGSSFLSPKSGGSLH